MTEQVIDTEYTPAGEVEPCVALTPTPQQDAMVANLKAEGEKYLAYAESATVTDLATAKQATNDIALLRGTLKLLEEKRKGYKAPLLEAGRELDRFFNEIAEPFKSADKCYSDKVLAYHKAEEIKRQEAAAINATVGSEVVEVPDQQKHVRAEAGTLGFTWVLDKEKVEAALLGGVQVIPGIHIWFEPKYKVLDIKKVPEEYKKQSTRVTR